MSLLCLGLLLGLAGCTEEVGGSPSNRKPGNAASEPTAARPAEPGSYGAGWMQVPEGARAPGQSTPMVTTPPSLAAPPATAATPSTAEATATADAPTSTQAQQGGAVVQAPATASATAAPPPTTEATAAAPTATATSESTAGTPTTTTPQPQAAGTATAASPSGTGAPAPAEEGRLEVTGRAIQGGLMVATLHGKLRRMDFPGHRTVVGDDGKFLIGFARDAKPTETLRITLADGKVIEHVFQVEQRSYETDRVDGLPDEEVKLDAATRAQVQKADGRLDKVRRAYSKIDCFDDGFAWPVTGKITSRYGQPRILNGVDGGIHWGLDIAANTGTSVRAPACGKVVFAETDVPLSGNVVVIDHGRGLTSTFLHLNKISTKVNDDVKQGAVFGSVGKTGRASGPHLDWRMNLFDIRLDPELVVPAAK